MADNIDKATENVEEMNETIKALNNRMEEVLKAQANIEKAMIRDNEEEKEVGKTSSFLTAKSEIAKGKTAPVPYWDDKTSKRFDEYAHMLYTKDYEGIKKAFGDNPQTAANWIPDEFRAEIIRLEVQNSIALQKCRIIPMSRDTLSMPAPTGANTVYWTDASAAILDSAFTAGVVQLDSAKMSAISLVPREALDDSAYPLASYIAVQMGEDFGKKLDEEVFQGDDSDTSNHKFDGWEYAASVQEVAGATDATPTFAELLTEDNLLSMVGKLDDIQVQGAEWFMTNQAWNAIRAIEDGASSKIVRLNEAYGYNLLGFPVNRRAQVGTSTATAERAAAFFGNPQWIFIGDRMDFGIDTSEHYRFANDQVTFRGTQRVAVKVAIPSALVRAVFGAAT